MLLSLLLLTIGLSSVVQALTENQLHVLKVKANYDNAVKLCKEQGWKLVQIHDSDTNMMVYQFSVKNKLSPIWIDGNDYAKVNEWRDSDGREIKCRPWYVLDPNLFETEKCIESSRFPNGQWNNINCNSQNFVICQDPVCS